MQHLREILAEIERKADYVSNKLRTRNNEDYVDGVLVAYATVEAMIRLKLTKLKEKEEC